MLSEKVFFSFDDVKKMIYDFMHRLIFYVNTRKNELLQEAEIADKEFYESSMLLLDQRLKAHVPLKGKLETDIYQIRSSEITDHKRR